MGIGLIFSVAEKASVSLTNTLPLALDLKAKGKE
jgi:hypothetical protein